MGVNYYYHIFYSLIQWLKVSISRKLFWPNKSFKTSANTIANIYKGHILVNIYIFKKVAWRNEMFFDSNRTLIHVNFPSFEGYGKYICDLSKYRKYWLLHLSANLIIFWSSFSVILEKYVRNTMPSIFSFYNLIFPNVSLNFKYFFYVFGQR